MEAIRLSNLVQADFLSSLPIVSVALHDAILEPSFAFEGALRGAQGGLCEDAQTSREVERLLASTDVGYLRLLPLGVLPRSGPQKVGSMNDIVETPLLPQKDEPQRPAIAPMAEVAQVQPVPLKDELQPPGRASHKPSIVQNSQQSKQDMYHHVEDDSTNCHQPAVKKRRTSAKFVNVIPAMALVSDVERVVDEAMNMGEAAQQVGHYASFASRLPSWMEAIEKLRSRDFLHQVPETLLLQLLQALEGPIERGAHSMLSEDDSLMSTSFKESKVALQCGVIVLQVMSTKDIPKTLLREELIDKLIDMVHFQVSRNVFMVFDSSYKQDHLHSEDLDNDNVSANRKSAGKLKSKQSPASLVRAGSEIMDMVCSTFTHLGVLLSAIRLQDRALFQLARTAISTFSVANVSILQLKAMGVISCVFQAYPEHHTMVMDDIVQLLWKLPVGKKHGRVYHLGDDGRQIHVISALVLQLLQCSVRLPPVEFDETNLESHGDKDTRCFKIASDLAHYFWKAIFDRWASLKSSEAADVRTLIEELVEDFLTALNLPEFPAAGEALQMLIVHLDGTYGLKSDNASVRGMAIDLLGVLASRLKLDEAACKKLRNPILQRDEPGEVKGNQHHGNGSALSCMLCSAALGSDICVTCGHCQGQFHSECIGGVGGTEGLSCPWTCHRCSASKRLQDFLPEDSAPDSDLVMKQILVDYLSSPSASLVASSAKRFLVSMWYSESSATSELKVYRSWSACSVPQGYGSSNHPLVLPRKAILEIALKMESERPFARSFGALLSRLLASLRDKPNNRAKAMKAVNVVIEADPSLLAMEQVKHEVEQRILDASISVREAAIDLVGKHMIYNPELASKYYDVICDRIKDRGVSVRKRVIKILRDLCFRHPNFDRAPEACSILFSRFQDDENSIRELVLKTMEELWFSGTQDETQRAEPDEVERVTGQMVEVMKQPKAQKALVAIIKQSMSEEKDDPSHASAVSAGKRAAIRRRCELMCKCLLERILKAQEDDAGDALALPYLTALHAFCEVDPVLCVPDLDPARFAVTLLPYLAAQGEQPGSNDAQAVNARMIETIVSILASLLPHIRRPPQTFVDELERNLKRFIARHVLMTVVQACVRCLCRLQDAARAPVQAFSDLIRQFCRALRSSGGQPAHAPRSMFALGLFCQYGAKHLDSDETSSVSLDDVLALLKSFLRSENASLKLKALQALGLVFLAVPDEMESEEVLDAYHRFLSPNSPSLMKIQVLKNLSDFFIDAEEKAAQALKSGPAGNDANGVAIAAGAGDSAPGSGPVQRHWEAVLECLVCIDADVRQAALKLVEVALGQAMVFPVKCVPCLMALEVDEVEAVRSAAHRLLAFINDRWGNYKFLESKFPDGMRMAFAMTMRKGEAEDGAQNVLPAVHDHVKEGVGNIYKLLRGPRTAKHNVMLSLIKRFDYVDSRQRVDLRFLMFCTEVLAALPFTTPDEPLYLVFQISRLAHLRGGSLQSALQNLLTGSSELAVAATSAYQQLLHEKRARQDARATESPERALSPSGCNETLDVRAGNVVDLLDQAKEWGEAAAAIGLLLHLKAWLKATYCLTDARCLAYSPAESMKTAEILQCKDLGSFTLQGSVIWHTDALCKVVLEYQSLKKLLKMESDDYTGLASPTASKGKRRASLTGGVLPDDDQNPGSPSATAAGVAPFHSAPARGPVARRGRPRVRKLSMNAEDVHEGDDADYVPM